MSRARGWWALWALASGVWLWFFGGMGLIVATGLFSEPTTNQRLTGAALTALGCAGPVLLLLVRRDRALPRRLVLVAAVAAAAAGAALALWFP